MLIRFLLGTVIAVGSVYCFCQGSGLGWIIGGIILALLSFAIWGFLEAAGDVAEAIVDGID